MVGHERNPANGHNGTGAEPASETTSIHLPPITNEPSIAPQLSLEERAAVEALPAGSALLVAHSGPNSGARFLLDSDITTAGRHPDADIFLDDVTVSRKHVEFRRTERSFEVVDTGSLNGTYVNHDRVDKVELRSGSEVQIGKFRLTFYLSPARAAGRS
ncbi:FHA domain-containing protein [Pseudarthrobacter sp. J75]|uniref:FHA domain-containing protein n=1 Tax=unclassified Pseudarthrobacter TaxID=2647000 RepID=UPI002E808CA9|nr:MULTISPECIES: FHA domain-containing protein [unclassified Pseudarthrobacter]MEE2522792.1 FHA domain-containing protein [Pseudarthrobacter sp. J47]MEE2529653.1 FHA domain-containing protein [Pseudarthrobacter sp. J75]MEE2569579.1 FHA domain-containing protein [Pseudarthrobacter sp. J64]